MKHGINTEEWELGVFRKSSRMRIVKKVSQYVS